MPVFRCLDQSDPEPLLLGDLGEPIQEHRLAGSAESDHQQALPGPSGDSATKGDAEAVDEVVAPGQRGRGSAGAGAVRVGQLIHEFNAV